MPGERGEPGQLGNRGPPGLKGVQARKGEILYIDI